MTYTLHASCGSFIGNGREQNQDNFFFQKKHLPIPNQGLKNPVKYSVNTEEPVVLALFDGMGGASRGDMAACLASEVFSREAKKLEELVLPGREFLESTCELAGQEINAFREANQLTTVGATVAALYFSQDEVVAGNVGDSRVYRIRDKKMMQISQDHTDAKLLEAMGISKKPVLLQYLGIPGNEMTIEPYIAKGELRSEDVYVLCTDGVTDVLQLQELYELICNHTAEEAVRQILAEVNKRNGSDNATVIVVKLV